MWKDFPSSLGFARHFRSLPVHYFVHDVVSEKIARSPLNRLLFPWAARVESSLLAKVSQCCLLSAKDEQLLCQRGFAGSAEVWGVQGLGVGDVDSARPIASVVAQFGAGPSLVFFGNMGRPENSRSLVHFALFRWHRVRRVFPQARFWVIGLASGPTLRALGRIIPGLEITGPVADPAPAFRAATLCIAPLLFGADVKVNVLQMLEAGATVIATPVGVEGIEADPQLIVVESDKLSARLVEHMQVINQATAKRFQQLP